MGCLHDSHSTPGHEDYHTLKCGAIQSSRHLWDWHRIVLRLPETQKWRHYVPSKYWAPVMQLHSVIHQKTHILSRNLPTFQRKFTIPTILHGESAHSNHYENITFCPIYFDSEFHEDTIIKELQHFLTENLTQSAQLIYLSPYWCLSR